VNQGDIKQRAADLIIGKTTSATFGYRVGRPVALAYLETGDVGEIEGLRVEIDIARNVFAGTASLAAAFDPRGERLRPPARVALTAAPD
jgi:glycine cleavage system aminomethyltransferase T